MCTLWAFPRTCRLSSSGTVSFRARGQLMRKVPTIQSCSVRRMHNHTSISEETDGIRVCGDIQLEVRSLEILLAGSVGDKAVFAAQVARLAGVGGSGIAVGCVLSAIWREVASSTRAVASLVDREFVDVVF